MRRIPISRRIVLLVILASVVPILAANLFAYAQAKRAVLDRAADDQVQMHELIRRNLELAAERGRTFIDELMVDPTIRNAVEVFSHQGDVEQNATIRSISKLIRRKVRMLVYLKDVRLVTLENQPIYSMTRQYIPKEELDEEYRRIRESDETEIWYLSRRNGRPVIALSRKIIHIGTLEPLGYLMLTIDPVILGRPEDFAVGRAGGRRSLILVDSFGRSYPFAADAGAGPGEDLIAEVPASGPRRESVPFGKDDDRFICSSWVEGMDWTIITSIPTEDLFASAESILVSTILMAALLLLLGVAISRIIMGSITAPLSAMVRSVSLASSRKFDIPPVDEADDELGYMAKAFNDVVRQVRALLLKVESEEREKRRAEVKMLQAQINPHFLFNTLDSLRFAAVMSSARSVSDGLTALSHLLRNSIVREDAMVSLEKEIGNITDYLTIQKIKYGDCVTFVSKVAPEARQGRIMKLLLQPIIENSILHGMGDQEEELCITLEARVEEGMMRILLTDDGEGFEPNPPGNRFSGIGLENVRERLRLRYGADHVFQLTSRPGKGTVVELAFTHEAQSGGDDASRSDC